METKTDNIMDIASAEMTSQQTENVQNLAAARDTAVGANQVPNFYFKKPLQQVRNYKKISRNDLCPCGSGKKYKHCCLDSGKYEGTHEI